MLKIYIDTEPEYIDIDIDDMFDTEKFVITGNRDYKDFIEASWYKHTTDVLNDLDNDTFTGESLSYYGDIDRAQRKALVKLYEDCRSIDDLETVAAAANILYPDRQFETRTIRGYCQREWNEIIYDENYSEAVNDIESYYFGKVAELHIEDGEETVWSTITDDELWQAERDDTLKETLLNTFGYPIDTPCELYESDGYTRIKQWKTA